MEHTIDAQGISLGRVATKAAVLLMGKNTPAFEKNTVAAVKVKIVNASKIKHTAKKLKETLHERYSGHPGGLKFRSNEQIIEQKGYTELFKLAVYGMLPPNKLRPIMMKNLTITE
jgi:large subunit ribosomal protein L13